MSRKSGSKLPSSGGQPSAEIPMPDIKRRGLKGFFTDVRREMRHVVWPTKAETMRLTGVVLGVCLMAIAVLYSLGMLFGWVLDQVQKLRG